MLSLPLVWVPGGASARLFWGWRVWFCYLSTVGSGWVGDCSDVLVWDDEPVVTVTTVTVAEGNWPKRLITSQKFFRNESIKVQGIELQLFPLLHVGVTS